MALGRPRQIEREDILLAGRQVGMRDLSLGAVAAQLGVSATALYRHVDGRWGLERLVGESLLAEFALRDDSRLNSGAHLLSFGMQVREHMLAHPGLAAYLQTLFPRGEGGRSLMAAEVAALTMRGYAPDAAIVLCSAVGSLAVGQAAAQDQQRASGDGLQSAREQAMSGLLSDVSLGRAHRDLPVIDAEEYCRLLLAAAIRGVLAVAPPGRAVPEIIAELGQGL